MSTSMARVTAAVTEFLNIWGCGGNASLKLDTSNGGCTVNFTAHLGHPGALLQPAPPSEAPSSFKSTAQSPVSAGQRYRGQGDKLRSKQRAASFQARAAAADTSSSTAESKTAAPAATLISAAEKVAIPAQTASVSPTSDVIPLPAPSSKAAVLPSQATGGASTSVKSAPLSLPPCPNCAEDMMPLHQCNVSSSLSSVPFVSPEPRPKTSVSADQTSGTFVSEQPMSAAASSPSSTPPGSPSWKRRIIRPRKFLN